MKAGLILTMLLGGLASTAYAYEPLQNAQINPDGSRTVQRGQQTPQANAQRQQFCEARGGVDVTNEGNVTLSAGAADVIVCQFPEGTKPDTGGYVPVDPLPESKSLSPDVPLRPAPSFVPGADDAQDEDEPLSHFGLPPDTALAAVPSISVYPVNGFSVVAGQTFYAAGTVVFANLDRTMQGTARSAIPALNCSWLWEGAIIGGGANIGGYVACHTNSPGVVATHIEGCIRTFGCAQGQGTVVITPRS
ncbi:Uncharacterised protein [Bordetella ansorpii]|uniref:Lipoprotein n=1 Tax=Bordetella ansorpii TaxID=288768 RepID=A0A157SS48_9BORD|nr:hypothetical protein [Bordetella ansorpii]SAI73134.1 Uncharacterised protein [Bordetella ansorpii]